MKISVLLAMLAFFVLTPLQVQTAAQSIDLNWKTPLPGEAAGTYTVTTLVDKNDHSCSEGDCSLRDAIEVSSPGSTIQFSVTGTITLNSALAINKSLTLSGPGADRLVLDGHTAFPVLNIGAANTDSVSLSGLTFANGNSGGRSGGNIYNDNIMGGGATLMIDACTIRAGISNNDGGGLFSSGVVNITNSRFEGNSAHDGGGIAQTRHNATITGTVFTGNSAVEDGGALYADGTNSMPIILTISRANFTSNTAARFGGALRIYSYASTVISDTLLFNNTTTGSNGKGGAIASESPLSVDKSVFYGNKTGSATTANNTGGAIHISNTLILINSTLYANQARSAGGGIYFGSNGTITNSTIYGNTLSGVGADPGLYFSSLTITAVNSIIAGNTYANNIIADCDDLGLAASSKNNLSTSAGCGASAPLTSIAALKLTWHGTYLLPGAGSPAIDAGDAASCPTTDQRGWSRPVDGGSGSAVCDIGAIEATLVFKELFLPLVRK
jgi:CSLREA domain-containing protein